MSVLRKALFLIFVRFFLVAKCRTTDTILEGEKLIEENGKKIELTCRLFLKSTLFYSPKPSIYLNLIFAILQFEISSLMNWIFMLVVADFETT